MVIDQHAGATTRVNLVEGKLRSFVNRTVGAGTPNFEVHTPNAVAAARGTLFILIFTPPGTTELQVLQGVVNLANLGNLPGGIDVQAGYKATVVGPNDPGQPVLLSLTGVFPWPLVIGGGLLGATAIAIPVAWAVDNSMSSGGPSSPSK